MNRSIDLETVQVGLSHDDAQMTFRARSGTLIQQWQSFPGPGVASTPNLASGQVGHLLERRAELKCSITGGHQITEAESAGQIPPGSGQRRSRYAVDECQLLKWDLPAMEGEFVPAGSKHVG